MRKAVSRIMPNRQRGHTAEQNPSHLSHDATSSFKVDFGSVSEFYIALDSPHNSWLPGDEISGQIILISKKNLADIVITLSLIGFVKINASSHSKLRPVRHNLFNHTIKIYGENQQSPSAQADSPEFSNGLFKGEHRFPFIVKLPNKRVFTSIDFGKGSITYILKASMGDAGTASSSSSPGGSESVNHTNNLLSKTKNLRILNSNYTSEKFIQLINPIDVATLPPPKPKKLIIKDPRLSKKLSRTQSSTSTVNTYNTYSTMSSNNSDPNEVPNSSNTPNSSGGNENDNTLAVNVLETSNTQMVTPSSQITYENPKPETIKVALTIPQRGYLRGELMPIKISVDHLRNIQDLNGIIVTFVRVCRLDNGPDGLYDSFRKDLAQAVIPLYVDPNTFHSDINTSIRIPADAFPTISGCPLVSFQYFIEVLINLSGKTVVLENIEPQKTSVTEGRNSPAMEFQHSNSNTPEHVSNSLNDFKFQFNYLSSATNFNQKERSTFVNTDKYKRMKKFLQLTSEVIIGTHRATSDTHSPMSNRMEVENTTSPLSRRSSPTSGASNDSPSNSSNVFTPAPPAQASSYINVIPESSEINNFNIPPYFDEGHRIPDYQEASRDQGSEAAPLPPQTEMSDKERMRAHESSLMPSEPPLLDDGDSPKSVSPVEGGLLGVPQAGDNHQSSSQVGGPANHDYNFFTTVSTTADNGDDPYTMDYVPHYEMHEPATSDNQRSDQNQGKGDQQAQSLQANEA